MYSLKNRVQSRLCGGGAWQPDAAGGETQTLSTTLFLHVAVSLTLICILPDVTLESLPVRFQLNHLFMSRIDIVASLLFLLQFPVVILSIASQIIGALQGCCAP